MLPQVSILVRPAAGGNAVLLNVPRSVAAKVNIGHKTTSLQEACRYKFTCAVQTVMFCVWSGEAGHHPIFLSKQRTKVHGELKMKTNQRVLITFSSNEQKYTVS